MPKIQAKIAQGLSTVKDFFPIRRYAYRPPVIGRANELIEQRRRYRVLTLVQRFRS
jgi:hypothetical protein